MYVTTALCTAHSLTHSLTHSLIHSLHGVGYYLKSW